MHKKLLIILSVFSLSFLQGEKSSLVVGTNAEFPPFCYVENNEIIGFDIDIAKEVGKRLGKEIELKDMPFDSLIPDIALGNVDFVAAGMSYTKERAKRVLFTKSYLEEDPLVILTPAKKPLGLEDLKGKNVVVIEGFTADLFMSSQKGVSLTRLMTQSDGFIALRSGRADAFVTAKSTVDAFLTKKNASKFTFSRIEGTGETCALVIPKEKLQMALDIQKALDAMIEDGTLDKLKKKWDIA